MSYSILQGAIELGMIYAIMSLGIFLSFRILNIPDLTVDGSFVSGCAVSAVCSVQGYPFLGIGLAFIVGGIAGICTGTLQTKCKIQPILSGILVMTGLYSINYHLMGNMPNIKLLQTVSIFQPFQSLSASQGTLYMIAFIAIVIFIFIYIFLKTQLGMCLRATGDNEAMVRASSINSDTMKILGIALANALVAFGGGILAQYQGFADLNDGTGKMVIGLASIIVGEAIFGKKTLCRSFMAVIFGSVIYRLILTLGLQIGVSASDQKLLSVILIILAITLPMLKQAIMKRRKRYA